MLSVVSVTNPVYINAENTMIDCDVVWSENGTTLPSEAFTASSVDTSSHGVALWSMLLASPADIDPYVEPVLSVADYKDLLATIRYEREVGGLTVNSVRYQTDRESKGNATALTLEGLVNGMVTVNWKLSDGGFQALEPRNFKQVAKSVFNYVNDCFGHEMALQAALDAATDPSTIDLTAGWPSDDVTVAFT